MTKCACRVLYGEPAAERLHGVAAAETSLLEALTAACGPSRRATVDLAQIAGRLGLRDLTWRIALLGLRVRGEVEVSHSPERFETATITLPPGGLECLR
jgi:hypothetical protein